MWRALRWQSAYGTDRPSVPCSNSARRRALRPEVETCEARRLLSAVARPPLGAAVHAEVTPARANPLAAYRVFEATIRRGPHAGTTFEGPLVLGVTGRIQVFGFFYPEKGTQRVAVVGTIFGGRASLRFILPEGGALEVSGSGRLQRVPRGIPGGSSLVGFGNLSGPARDDFGRWETLAPSRVNRS